MPERPKILQHTSSSHAQEIDWQQYNISLYENSLLPNYPSHLPIPSSIWPFVTYSCPPAETGSLWPFHGMGIPISISLFFGSSMTSLNLSIHHRTNKITTWSKTFLFLFFLWIYLHLNFSDKLAVLNKGGHIYDHSPFVNMTFLWPSEYPFKL